jgi:hypothetical protein
MYVSVIFKLYTDQFLLMYFIKYLGPSMEKVSVICKAAGLMVELCTISDL